MTLHAAMALVAFVLTGRAGQQPELMEIGTALPAVPKRSVFAAYVASEREQAFEPCAGHD